MRKILLSATGAAVFFSFFACKKSDSTSNARTVQNMSGSYLLTSLVWTYNGASYNIYDSLPDCQTDNIFRLDADGTAHEIDAKIPCVPPEADSVATWGLSPNADSLYFNSQPVFIKSWDGKTLVYTGPEELSPTLVIGTTTLVKQ